MHKLIATLILTLAPHTAFANCNIVTIDNPRVSVDGRNGLYIQPTAHWFDADKICKLFGYNEFVSIQTDTVLLTQNNQVAYINMVTKELLINDVYAKGDRTTIISRLSCR